MTATDADPPLPPPAVKANLPPIYNSRLMKLYFTYLRTHYTHLDLDQLLKEARLTKLEIDAPGHWFNQEQVDLLHQKVLEATGNPDISREVGRFAASSDATGAIKPRALGLLNISSIYLLLSKFHPMLSRGARVKASKLSANKVRIIVSPEEGVTEKPYQCENRLGIFESLATLFTAKYATVVHDRCVHRGDADCCYEVSWEEPPHRRWERFLLISLIALAIFMAVGPWLFALSGWLIGLVVGLAALLSISTYTHHLEKLDLRRTIQNQGNIAEDHIKEVDFRYRGALLVQKIGQATSEMLDLNQLAQVVMCNIRDYLDFDRGVLMLPDERRKRLVFAAGFGFDADAADLLRGTQFHLDNPEAQGPFIQSFKEQHPILVEDVNAMSASFSPRSQTIARDMGSTSLIVLPMVYER